MQVEGGIYVYWFKNTGLDNCEQSYVGSTVNFHKRHREHLNILERNKHMNNNFQHAYNKYGKENMIYEVVDKMVFTKEKKIDPRAGRARESLYIPILEFDLNSNFIKEYSSIKMAAIKLGIKPCNISSVLKGRTKQTFGKFFKYKP